MQPLVIKKIDQYINDISWVLSSQYKQENEALYWVLHNETGYQIVTVLFPHRKWRELKEIGIELFNDAGIGDAEKNNGLLLIIATEEKKIRIVVGKWLEWIFPDQWCRNLIETELRPCLEKSDYEELLRKWYTACKRNIPKVNSFSSSKGKWSNSIIENPITILSIIGITGGYLVWLYMVFPILLSIFWFLPLLGLWILTFLSLVYIYRKNKKNSFIFFTILFIGIFSIITANNIEKKEIYCQQYPAECVETQSTNSSENYESDSIFWWDSWFSGGWGSTNGAWWGD